MAFIYALKLSLSLTLVLMIPVVDIKAMEPSSEQKIVVEQKKVLFGQLNELKKELKEILQKEVITGAGKYMKVLTLSSITKKMFDIINKLDTLITEKERESIESIGFELGNMFEQVSLDKNAAEWYNLSTKYGGKEGPSKLYTLASRYEEQDKLAKAKELYLALLNAGYLGMLYKLGNLHKKMFAAATDPKKREILKTVTIHYFTQAFENHQDERAAIALANLLSQQGQTEQAKKYYQAVTRRSKPIALFNLAVIAEQESIAVKDPVEKTEKLKEARQYYLQVKESQHPSIDSTQVDKRLKVINRKLKAGLSSQ